MAIRRTPGDLRAEAVVEEAIEDNSSIHSGSSSSSVDSSTDGPVYGPVSTGAGAHASECASVITGDADSAIYEAHRIRTAATATTAADDLAPPTEEEEKAMAPPKLSFRERLGLDNATLMLMLKGSLPPIIGVAITQSTGFSKTYTTVGYLVPIVTVICVAVMPRGKFIQTFTLNVLSLSMGAALALLILFSGVQARKNTTSPPTAEELALVQSTGRPPYNSSQSAVCAVWLVFCIWLINMIRAKLPTMNLPSIVFSIFINVCCTTGPLMTNMTQAMKLIQQIYTAMLMAMAIAAGVSLLIFPISSRKILMAQAAGAIGLLRKAVVLQGAYLRGIECEDVHALVTVETAVGDLGPAKEEERKQEKLRQKFSKGKIRTAGEPPPPPPISKEEQVAQALRGTIAAMRELAGKMQLEVRFAKRDAAFGKLTAHDLGEIVRLLRNIFVPVTGMSTIMDISRRKAEYRGKNAHDSEEQPEEALAREKERRVWNEVMKQLHEPFVLLAEAIDEGLEHVGLQLGLLPKTKEQKAKDKEARNARKAAKAAKSNRRATKPASVKKLEDTGGTTSATASVIADSSAFHDASEKSSKLHNDNSATSSGGSSSPDGKNSDIEAAAGVVKPGDEGFAEIMGDKVKTFYSMRSEILRVWAKERGLMDRPLSPVTAKDGHGLDPAFLVREQRQSQLYVLLYMEQLMIATGEAVQDFVEFADKRVADGTMDKTRFLFPTLRRIRKWVISVFSDKGATNDDTEEVLKPNFNVVFMGDGFNTKKDPEHLPPVNAWQHFGNGLRMISRFLGSDESVFGMRVVCATLTVGIVCYLQPTQRFFQEQRLVWAMVIIAIGMTQTSGQSIFGFLCRIGGSFIAMIISYIVWYIADENTAAIVVVLWLFIFCEYYFFLKYPRFMAANMITIITQVLIIGYELQVRKIGLALAESTGQRYYPTYELAPYRLATVAGGSLVAFFWTIFPRPMTDRAWLRRDLSATLYLLANYFSVINETLKSTLHGTGGSSDVPGTPSHQLFKVRQKLLSKLLLLLPSLQMHLGWQKWEPTIGGEFPRAAYEDVILRSGRILNYLTLISYTVTWKPRHAPGLVNDASIKALTDLIRSIGPTHYTILSTLALLSNSLLSGQSLPPYIPLPRPYELTRHLLKIKQRAAAPAPLRSIRVGTSGSDGVVEGGDNGDAGSGAATTTGTATNKQPLRRRNSIWGKQSWRPDAGSVVVGSNGGGGMYERQTEEDVVESHMVGGGKVDHRRRSTAASRDRTIWHEVTSKELNTATGVALPTGNTADLVASPTGDTTALDFLDARNIEQHGFTEFAVLQVCSTLVCDDLEGMIQAVSGLVGVVDFSFRIDESNDSLGDGGDKGKGKME